MTQPTTTEVNGIIRSRHLLKLYIPVDLQGVALYNEVIYSRPVPSPAADHPAVVSGLNLIIFHISILFTINWTKSRVDGLFNKVPRLGDAIEIWLQRCFKFILINILISFAEIQAIYVQICLKFPNSGGNILILYKSVLVLVLLIIKFSTQVLCCSVL